MRFASPGVPGIAQQPFLSVQLARAFQAGTASAISHTIGSMHSRIPPVRVFARAAQHRPLEVLTMIEVVPGIEPLCHQLFSVLTIHPFA